MGWKDEDRKRVKEAGEKQSLTLEVGETTLRILPNKRDPEKRPYIEFPQHRVGPNKEKERAVRCGKKLNGEGECWLCDVKIPELESSQHEQKRALAQKFAAVKTMIVQVSVVSDGKFGKPRTWWMKATGPKSLGIRVMGLLASSKRSYEDPERGYNITITRTGTGMNTDYPSIIPDEDSTKVPSKLLEASKTLLELAPKYDEAAQKDAYFGRDPKKDSDSDDVRSRPRGGKPKDDEYEDAEVEETDYEDTEEVEEEYEEPSEASDEEYEAEEETEEGDGEGEDESSYEDDENQEEYEEEQIEEEREEEEEEAPRRAPAKKKAPSKAPPKAPAKKVPTKKQPPTPVKKKAPVKGRR